LNGYVVGLPVLESEVCPWRNEGTTVKAPAVRATALIASRRVIIGFYCTSNGKGGHFGKAEGKRKRQKLLSFVRLMNIRVK
jgi:hypothetical protein